MLFTWSSWWYQCRRFMAELELSILNFPGRSSLTVIEAAKAMECTSEHIGNFCRSGEIKAVFVGPGRNRFRIPMAAWREFILGRMTGKPKSRKGKTGKAGARKGREGDRPARPAKRLAGSRR